MLDQPPPLLIPETPASAVVLGRFSKLEALGWNCGSLYLLRTIGKWVTYTGLVFVSPSVLEMDMFECKLYLVPSL